MRKLCPNYDREDSLDTVLEVPIPDDMLFSSSRSSNNDGNHNGGGSRSQNLALWIKSQANSISSSNTPSLAGRNAELQLLLNVVGSPLIPCPVPTDQALLTRSIRDCSIQASTARYIVQQYVAATGGQAALNSVVSWYAIGKVKMSASEFHIGDETVSTTNGARRQQGDQVGSFVLWQKTPELWYLELIVSGCKVSAGSNGKVAWRQSLGEQSHASRGPPRPLRRSLQGLDPKSTANVFTGGVCIGEKVINNEDCFVLKLESNPATLKARSSTNSFEIIHHTLWGYFSQRTGLLIQFEDSHLLRMKKNKRQAAAKSGRDDDDEGSIFWETSMESVVEDYRYIDGINIAHAGRTTVTLFRYGEGSANHKRKMEEAWTIEEVDFNIRGLTMDCFLPPADLKQEHVDGDDRRRQSTDLL